MRWLGVGLNIFILVLVLMFTHQKQYKKLFFIIILSTLGDVFGLSFIGPAIRMAQVVGILNLPRTFPYVFRKISDNTFLSLKFIAFEFVILILTGIYFGFINPWFDPRYIRSWNQAAQGRTIITWINFISNYSIILFVIYVVAEKKINYFHFTKYLSIISIINLTFALVNYISPLKLAPMIWGVRDLAGRFYGWFGEPKEFGKTSAMAFLLFYIIHTYKLFNAKFVIIGMLATFTIIILSMSTSTLVMLLLLFILLNSFKYGDVIKTVLVKNFAGYVLSMVLGGLTLYGFAQTDMYKDRYSGKIEKVLYSDTEDVLDEYEPIIFTKFEIWDRVASNFLHRNPQYLLLGVGPNLIHIPATNYKSKKHSKTWSGALNSIPKMGWLNIIARSGFFGFFLWISAMISLFKSAQKQNNNMLYVLGMLAFAYYFISYGQWFFILFGYVLGSLYINKKEKNAFIYNTRSKWRTVYCKEY